jgi:hypothetical protein
MGLIDGILGHASKIDVSQVQKEFNQILANGERVEQAYQLIRDYFVFTNKRLVIVDRQGITGKKIDYHSVPYKNITHFSIETAGHFDLDAELKIWLSGMNDPIQKQFNSRLNIYEVQSVLAAHVLGLDEQSRQGGQVDSQHSRTTKSSDERGYSKSLSLSDSTNIDSSDMEFCFHCGESVKANAKKCTHCGGVLD